MQKRHQLRRHIINAWHKTIDDAYSNRLINSERSLQLYFCSNLLAGFGGDLTRSVFIEPSFTCPSTRRRRSPDVVVCHSQKMIAVIELKFLPRGVPNLTKDLETLEWLSSVGEAVTLSNDRYLGAAQKVKKYAIADDAVFCWGGVYKGPQITIEAGERSSRAFLALHACTKAGASPLVSPAMRR